MTPADLNVSSVIAEAMDAELAAGIGGLVAVTAAGGVVPFEVASDRPDPLATTLLPFDEVPSVPGAYIRVS